MIGRARHLRDRPSGARRRSCCAPSRSQMSTLRMDLQEEAPAGADELRAKLGGTSAIVIGRGCQVALQAVELRHEVAVELGLQVGQRGLGGLRGSALASCRITAAVVSAAACEVLGRACSPASAATMSSRRLSVGERCRETIEVDRARAADPDRRDQRREALHDDRDLLGAGPSGMTRSTESTSETRRQGARTPCCFCRSSSSVAAEASALKPERPVVGEDAPLPDDGLGAHRLQVQQVVVEARPSGSAQTRPPSAIAGHDEHGLGIAREALERRARACARADARAGSARADGRRGGDRRGPAPPGTASSCASHARRIDGARDEAELLDAAEVGQHEHEEGAARR